MDQIQIGQYTKNWKTFEVARKFPRKFPSCLKWAHVDFMPSMGLSSLGSKLLGGKLKKKFKGIWRLFYDSLARRDTYITINRSDQFPLMFCQTRGVEDVPVATRALEIGSFVVAVVEHFQALPSSTRPFSNKSYDILVKHHKDNSIKFKFQFFYWCWQYFSAVPKAIPNRWSSYAI